MPPHGMHPTKPTNLPAVRCFPTHRLEHQVSLEFDVVHEVALDVGADVDLQVGIVLDEAVDDYEVPSEVVGNLVTPSSGNRNVSLVVGHLDEELKRLIFSQTGGMGNSRNGKSNGSMMM